MKKCISLTAAGFLFFVFVLQGCGSPNNPYVKKDPTELQSIKVARYQTPPFRAYNSGSMIGAIVVSGVLFGGLGAGIGYAVHRGISAEPDDPNRPDFGKLVTDLFIERSQKEIPGWPALAAHDKTILAPLVDDSCNILEIQVDDIKLENSSKVLMINTTITMRDRLNNIRWEKGYAYDSLYFQRFSALEDLKADNYSLLKKEYVFAAEKTVTDFIDHFNGSSSTPLSK